MRLLLAPLARASAKDGCRCFPTSITIYALASLKASWMGR
jgi:hypothetical protein